MGNGPNIFFLKEGDGPNIKKGK